MRSFGPLPTVLRPAGILTPLRMKRTAWILGPIAALAGCGHDTSATFGEPNEVAADSRNYVWDASTTDRLGIDMRRFQNSGADPAAGGPTEAPMQVVGDTPTGWQQVESKRQFRDAVWLIDGQPQIDCYLTIGVGGGVAFNVRRWYQDQFGLPVPDAATLPEIAFFGDTGRLCELAGEFGGKSDQAALIAFSADGDRITSLKMTGPGPAIEQQRDAFLALAASLRMQRGSAATSGVSATSGQQPSAGPLDPGAKPPQDAQHAGLGPAPAAASPFTATTPDGWTRRTDTQRLLHHTFGDGGEVYLSQLGGKLQQSLGIWRGQFVVDGKPLGPLGDEEFAALPRVQFLGDDAVLMEVAGEYRSMAGGSVPDAMLLLAARQEDDAITFCKLVGSATEVTANRDAFIRFLGSIRRTQ